MYINKIYPNVKFSTLCRKIWLVKNINNLDFDILITKKDFSKKKYFALNTILFKISIEYT